MTKKLRGFLKTPLDRIGLRPTRKHKETFRNLIFIVTMTSLLKTVGKFGFPRNQLNDTSFGK